LYSIRTASASEHPVHRVGDVRADTGQQVAVDVERGADVGVPEDFLNAPPARRANVTTAPSRGD
jgi:hypothetical protein